MTCVRPGQCVGNLVQDRIVDLIGRGVHGTMSTEQNELLPRAAFPHLLARRAETERPLLQSVFVHQLSCPACDVNQFRCARPAGFCRGDEKVPEIQIKNPPAIVTAPYDGTHGVHLLDNSRHHLAAIPEKPHSVADIEKHLNVVQTQRGGMTAQRVVRVRLQAAEKQLYPVDMLQVFLHQRLITIVPRLHSKKASASPTGPIAVVTTSFMVRDLQNSPNRVIFPTLNEAFERGRSRGCREGYNGFCKNDRISQISTHASLLKHVKYPQPVSRRNCAAGLALSDFFECGDCRAGCHAFGNADNACSGYFEMTEDGLDHLRDIQWFPGHMNKARKEIGKASSRVDVFVEILDSRIPGSSMNPLIETLRGDKPRVTVLSKPDLADPERTEAWRRFMLGRMDRQVLVADVRKRAQVLRIPAICRDIVERSGRNRPRIVAMVTGIPNSGKSTLINTLGGRAVARTADEPAVTRQQQLIRVVDGFSLLDTPGLTWPKIESRGSGFRLAVTGAIRDTALSYHDIALFALEFLRSDYGDRLVKRYNIQTLEMTATELLGEIGHRRGCLVKGGSVDLDKAGRILIRDIRGGRLGRITWERPDDEREKHESGTG